MPPACDVQRLLAEPVAGEQEAAAASIPEADGEHAVEALEAARAVLLVGVHDHLDVGAAREPMAAGFQLSAQPRGIVYFPVRHQAHGTVLADERLLAPRQVDDLEPPGGQRDAAAGPGDVLVRTAVGELKAHHLHQLAPRAGRAASAQDPGDAAHGMMPPSTWNPCFPPLDTASCQARGFHREDGAPTFLDAKGRSRG